MEAETPDELYGSDPQELKEGLDVMGEALSRMMEELAETIAETERSFLEDPIDGLNDDGWMNNQSNPSWGSGDAKALGGAKEVRRRKRHGFDAEQPTQEIVPFIVPSCPWDNEPAPKREFKAPRPDSRSRGRARGGDRGDRGRWSRSRSRGGGRDGNNRGGRCSRSRGRCGGGGGWQDRGEWARSRSRSRPRGGMGGNDNKPRKGHFMQPESYAYKEIIIPNKFVAKVIGTGGVVVGNIHTSSGADIKIRKETTHLGFAKAIVTGTVPSVAEAERQITEILGIQGEIGFDMKDIDIEPDHVRCIIGPAGSIIKDIRAQAGGIPIEIRDATVPGSATMQKVHLGPGRSDQIEIAERLINEKVADHQRKVDARKSQPPVAVFLHPPVQTGKVTIRLR